MTPGTGHDMVATVLARYPLDVPEVVERFEASTRNDNYLVRDGKGARYVLRRYRRNRDPERVALQLRLQQHLLDHHYPTPPIVPTTEDAPALYELDGPWALFGFVEGEHYDFQRPEQAREAGRRLAEFHRISEAFRETYQPHPLERTARDYVAHGQREVQRIAARFAGEAIAEDLAIFQEWLAELAAAVPLARLDALPGGWVHHDYHGRNLVFAGDRLVALLDFDNMIAGPYALDIVRGLHAFGREGRGSNVIRLPVAARFLEGYESLRPLAPGEGRDMLALIGVGAAPIDSHYPMLEQYGMDPLEGFRMHVADLRRARDRAADLAPLFEA